MAQQTAVDWFYDKVDDLISDELRERVELLKNEAKQMEKEQIMRAAMQCHFEGVRQSAKTSEEYIAYAEQYYNETYNK